MLIGHLGADPELRYTPSGIPVATFRIATNETWRDADGNLQERTEWHTIVVWRKLAELTNDLLKKGSRVYVEGRIQSRSYEDRNGIRRTVTEIVADDIILLDPKTSSESSLQAPQKTSATQDTTETATSEELKDYIIPPEVLSDDEVSQKFDDDLPF